MTFSEYIENLAERHVDIRHKENDEVHFLSSEREKHTALDSVCLLYTSDAADE